LEQGAIAPPAVFDQRLTGVFDQPFNCAIARAPSINRAEEAGIAVHNNDPFQRGRQCCLV
jgi:hypothetical protein